ncbi:hypothetical protein LWI28_000677 [Acer negundo]|uniref:Uncharacterized protein n=1 Tax=Acer negundo TaxID=4023 RepID=A0AAD5JFM9_ACENE|nr:hypothetical protein LWI28_000677 [Acer negundo]
MTELSSTMASSTINLCFLVSLRGLLSPLAVCLFKCLSLESIDCLEISAADTDSIRVSGERFVYVVTFWEGHCYTRCHCV